MKKSIIQHIAIDIKTEFGLEIPFVASAQEWGLPGFLPPGLYRTPDLAASVSGQG